MSKKKKGSPKQPAPAPKPKAIDPSILSSKPRRTWERMWEEPTRSDIRWNDIVSLLKALGGETRQGNGSRVRFFLNGRRAVFHEPHPSPSVKEYAVKGIRDFFTNAGLKKP